MTPQAYFLALLLLTMATAFAIIILGRPVL